MLEDVPERMSGGKDKTPENALKECLRFFHVGGMCAKENFEQAPDSTSVVRLKKCQNMLECAPQIVYLRFACDWRGSQS